MAYQYTMVFKTLKFDANWTYRPAGENVFYTATNDNARMWVMTEGPAGNNVGYPFNFKKDNIVGVSFYTHQVVLPLSDTDVRIPPPPP